MAEWPTTARSVAVVAGYALLGAVLTAALGLAALFVLTGIQPHLYDALYLTLGPSGATGFAIFGHFALAGMVGIVLTGLAGHVLSDRTNHLREVGIALAAVPVLLVLFVAASLADVAFLGGILLWVVAIAVAVPALLWFHFDLHSGALPAFLGGVPVIVLMLLLAGVGVGWGWGYVVTAQEIPAGDVGDEPVATLDDAPEVKEDLFADRNCETTADGLERCQLMLRGYIREKAAAQSLASHGVRCPYEGTFRDSGSFVASHDDRYYRVTCQAHGD